ncbi:MAG TPA: PocR ligand-binding domain-containing protein, partial [Bacillota bacterium]|nr:PocR ligand-binding domain-containing protein [Bacillota bacterium]
MKKNNEVTSSLLPAAAVSTEEINICDIIDLEFLQRFQDAFGKAFGVAGLSTDKNGNPITNPTNFTDFCMRLTRGSHKGLEGCMRSDAKGGAESASTGKPAVYFCDNGLMDFGAPIILNGQQIGSILGGQVLPDVPEDDKFRQIATEIGVDPEEYVAALHKVRIVPEEQVRAAADLLFVVASEISKTGYERFVLKQMIAALNRDILQMTATMQQFSASAATVSHYQKALNQEIQEVNIRSEEINEVLES